MREHPGAPGCSASYPKCTADERQGCQVCGSPPAEHGVLPLPTLVGALHWKEVGLGGLWMPVHGLEFSDFQAGGSPGTPHATPDSTKPLKIPKGHTGGMPTLYPGGLRRVRCGSDSERRPGESCSLTFTATPVGCMMKGHLPRILSCPWTPT